MFFFGAPAFTPMNRIQYIDAARGLAMFTVVYSHICMFCIPDYGGSPMIGFLREYFLNAFFFISGFIALRSSLPDRGKIASQLWRKTCQLLIPTILFGAFYALSRGISPGDMLFDGAKYGYWFTFVLYEMYLVYLFVAFAASFFTRRRRQAFDIIVLAVTALIYLVHKRAGHFEQSDDLLCLGNFLGYFIFFGAGLFAASRKTEIARCLDYKGGVIVLLCAVLICLDSFLSMPRLLYRFSVLLTVVYVLRRFYASDRSIPLEVPFKNSLTTLGRYTLEIYFIHYFLLFPLPASLGEYLRSLTPGIYSSVGFPEILTVGTVTLLTCYACILLSALIDRIPYLPRLAFGKTARV